MVVYRCSSFPMIAILFVIHSHICVRVILLVIFSHSLQNLPELEERRTTTREQLTGIQTINVGRMTIVKDMLKFYREHTELCCKEKRVFSHNESGVDMGGLTRELFTVF